LVRARLGPVSAAIIECLHIAGDQQHLDVAAGTGEPGLTIARLAPRGHVVLADLAAEMLGVAARRAEARGITNFETRVCSADDLPFGDAAFDSISVRFGYMFFPDVAAATAEFARVLKPGGRFAVSDVVVRGAVPHDIRRNMELWVGCIAGALEESEYVAKLATAGFQAIGIEPTRIYDLRDALEFLSGHGIDVHAVAPAVRDTFRSAFVRARKPASG